MVLQRISRTGAAPPTGLNGSISASATTFALNSGSGYPTGTGGPFVLVLDPGTPLEEKVLCASLSGATVTVASGGRGWDGTTASAHSSGAGNVAQVFSAAEADDDNAHVYDTTRHDHTQYAPAAAARGSILGLTSYNPGSVATYTLTSSLLAVDTINLTVAFIAPASGSVLCRVESFLRVTPSATTEVFIALAMFTHNTSTPVTSVLRVLDIEPASTAAQFISVVVPASVVVGGLTPGSNYQWDLGASITGSGTGQILAGGGAIVPTTLSVMSN